jgi:MbtH protein
MDKHSEEDNTTYQVVINGEEQYSIWPSTSALPAGWTDGGRRGSKLECLEYIREVWIDMRPRSLREKMSDSSARS